MDKLRQIISKLIEFWGRMSLAQKLSLVICLIALVILVVITLNLAVKQELVPLFYETPPPDVVYNIKKKLEEKGIPFELKDTMIYVPQNVKSQVIVDLYGEGVIPEGTDLYKWVFEPDITATKAKRTAQWIVTLQKRLEIMISSLEEVKSARVNITLPPETITFGERAKPKAGVTLHLKTGKTLKKSTAIGIGRLVASSVENLNPKDVTIVDTSGRYYPIPDEKDVVAMTGEQLDIKKGAEEYYKQKLLEQFSFIQANLIVTVDVTLDFTTSTIEKNKPEAIETDFRIHKVDEKGAVDSATPGNLGNLPQEPLTKADVIKQPGTMQQPSREESETETKSEIVNTEKINTMMPPGKVNNLTCAIVVPYERAIMSKDGKTPDDDTTRDRNIKTNLEEWLQLAAQTTGIDVKEAPQKIKITPISFVPPPPISEPTLQEKILTFLKEKYALIILSFLSLIAMFFIYKIVRGAYPKDVLAELERIRAELVEKEEEKPISAEEVMMEQIKDKIKETVKKNPRGVASLVKRWITQIK